MATTRLRLWTIVLGLLTLNLALADVVRIPFTRQASAISARNFPPAQRQNPRLSKRASITESLLNNSTGGSYFASVTVGTPGQTIQMVIDTGSSDAFVVQSNADLCTNVALQQEYQASCGTTYDKSKSSSYKLVVANGFEIQYLDGSTASGDYISEQFGIGGVTVSALQIGSANSTVTGTGILGIGLDADEAAQKQYPNIIDAMVTQKLINSKAYSLYLDDYAASTGSILFGGVDTKKFIGTLTVVPVLPDAETGTISSFTVALGGVGVSLGGGSSASIAGLSGGLDAILDSGTTLAYLPDAIAEALFSTVGAKTLSDESGNSLTVIDCTQKTGSKSPTISFRFGAATINVPASELILDTLTTDDVGQALPFSQTCVFGIQPEGDSSATTTRQAKNTTSFALLGDTFLRSAYVVYDLDHLQIGLAQSNFNSADSNVVEIPATASGLSGYAGVANAGSSGASPTLATTTLASSPDSSTASHSSLSLSKPTSLGSITSTATPAITGTATSATSTLVTSSSSASLNTSHSSSSESTLTSLSSIHSSSATSSSASSTTSSFSSNSFTGTLPTIVISTITTTDLGLTSSVSSSSSASSPAASATLASSASTFALGWKGVSSCASVAAVMSVLGAFVFVL